MLPTSRHKLVRMSMSMRAEGVGRGSGQGVVNGGGGEVKGARGSVTCIEI